MIPMAGTGEMGRRVLGRDWSAGPLGPMTSWPQSLRTALSICLASRFPQLIWWGPERVQLYNDAYTPVLGAKHPESLGQPGHECWAEIWDVVGPLYDHVVETGESTWNEDLVLLMNRHGWLEETYFTFSYSPIRDETGDVGGVLVTCVETTGRVLGARRLQTLRELGSRATSLQAGEGVCALAASALERNRADIPFALCYLASDEADHLALGASVGLEPGSPEAPERIERPDAPRTAAPWAVHEVLDTGTPAVVDLGARRAAFPGGPWDESPTRAILLPIQQPSTERPYGVLVAGVSPLLRLDDDYRGFFELVAQSLANAFSNADAYAAERRRAEALAEIDRAKMAFFTNISHEFRTPLTLQMAPLEDVLRDPALPEPQRDALTMVHRNTLRLLKLVNTLLDFSRIEAGRAETRPEPTDLARYTAELASWFRSTMEAAGLRFEVACPPLPEPVWIDREHWEKVVLNLLSNAFKFTLEGRVRVDMRHEGGEAVLEVSDTGVGIAAEALPHVFDRFHRVQGSEGRTHEGSGIGLALVRELVRMQGGRVDVESTPGRGTTFRVAVPFGHADADAAPTRRLASTALGVAPFVEEAMRWLPEPERRDAESGLHAAGEPAAEDAGAGPGHEARVASDIDGARIVLADDNADMRAYLTRLLGERFEVEAFADGESAFRAARERVPDLVLTDVMMPRLDGFGLLAALRADEATRAVPVVLLSARAGEESRIEGLATGADEYLTKPFSSRELLARVEAQIKLARLRRASAARLEQLYAAERRAVRARDEMMAVVSHDLRSPLSSIEIAMKVLRRTGASEQQRSTIGLVDRAVEEMQRLIGDLLDAARLEAGMLEVSPAPTRPERLLADAETSLRLLVEEHGLELRTEAAPGLPAVAADAARVLHIFQNLAGNAVKFTSEGTITLRAEAVEGGVRFAVDDTGPGIAPDRLPHLFDRYWQGERGLGDGLGLGLSIVKGLAEAHGGTVGVETRLGRGSTFWFTLPLAPGA